MDFRLVRCFPELRRATRRPLCVWKDGRFWRFFLGFRRTEGILFFDFPREVRRWRFFVERSLTVFSRVAAGCLSCQKNDPPVSITILTEPSESVPCAVSPQTRTPTLTLPQQKKGASKGPPNAQTPLVRFLHNTCFFSQSPKKRRRKERIPIGGQPRIPCLRFFA